MKNNNLIPICLHFQN
ncbi:Protein CBG25927 [Caenorhabditis briggsae]|uniref:Protein CBG25927 n=1 Tax=Caenorhabditis briggsae TaxID=6238 RepID=B6IK59_CAEBR|nr:Protein CBG25927 [Caenorhabditis briggsae]CAS00289.1 Protein CBG25927 [Caenorhabditis briggsae]